MLYNKKYENYSLNVISYLLLNSWTSAWILSSYKCHIVLRYILHYLDIKNRCQCGTIQQVWDLKYIVMFWKWLEHSTVLSGNRSCGGPVYRLDYIMFYAAVFQNKSVWYPHRILALRLKLNFRIYTSVLFQVKVYIVSSTAEMSICVIFQVEWFLTPPTLAPKDTTTPWSMRWVIFWDCTMCLRVWVNASHVMTRVKRPPHPWRLEICVPIQHQRQNRKLVTTLSQLMTVVALPSTKTHRTTTTWVTQVVPISFLLLFAQQEEPVSL